MDPWKQFERDIASIHGGGNPEGKNIVDVRHAELMAMANAFLGKGYSADKLGEVERLQVLFERKQTELMEQLTRGKIRTEEYVTSVNALIGDTFVGFERALGKDDFGKMFGAAPEQLSVYLDLDKFKAAQEEELRQAQVVSAHYRELKRAGAGGRTRTVSQRQIAAGLADKHNMSKKASNEFTDALVAAICKHLKKGDRVRLPSLGIFQVRQRKARMGINPKTREPIKIKASKKVAFRVAKELKTAI